MRVGEPLSRLGEFEGLGDAADGLANGSASLGEAGSGIQPYLAIDTRFAEEHGNLHPPWLEASGRRETDMAQRLRHEEPKLLMIWKIFYKVPKTAGAPKCQERTIRHDEFKKVRGLRNNFDIFSEGIAMRGQEGIRDAARKRGRLNE